MFAVFFRPAPAQAVVPLAAVAVGAVIAATGVMVAGAGVYKPPTFAQANAVADAVIGDISRKVIVARMFGEGATAGLKGFSSQYTLDYSKAKQWVKDHPVDFPVLSPPVNASNVPQGYSPTPFSTGDVLPGTYGGSSAGILSMTYDSGWLIQLKEMSAAIAAYSDPPYARIGGNQILYIQSTSVFHKFFEYIDSSHTRIRTITYSSAYTTSPVTDPIPYLDSPPLFAAAYPQTQAGQDETDKIAADNPSAVKTPPQAITPDQIKEAGAQASAAAAESTAVTAEAAAAADPTNTALQIAADQARAAAIQAAIDAQTITGELETTKSEEEEKTNTPPPAGPALDQDLQVDFSPFLGLKDKAMGKFPFSAVASLGSIFSGLTADPVTPSMDMPMPWGLPSAKISLSKWDDFAVKWRFLIAMMFHVSCIYAIVRRYA